MTDIAKYRNDNDSRFVIQNWMRNRNTVEFLAVWEELHNPDFNRVQFEAVRSEAGLNRFVMTPTKWIEQTNAIGIVSKAGRYGGGTYAQSALNWMEKTDGIECSLGKCRMIIGEICRQKAAATVENICIVKSNTWWYTIRNRRCILWQQKLQM